MDNNEATAAIDTIAIPVTGFRTLSVTLPDGNIIPYSRFVLMLFKPMDVKNMMVHAAMGLAGEAGEYIDAIKKHVFYGKELDVANATEELGDLAFFLQAACNTHGLTIEEVLQANANKLAKRYSSLTYSDADAQARKDKV
jgi:NTP pyrophosphatase (non-canonical NTP hydrolase)